MPPANSGSLDYHLHELAIATAAGHERRSLPVLPARCERVLDVGCGIGQTLVALGLDSTVEAHGVDIDAAAIAFGCQRFPRLRLQVSPGERLPFPDAHFDLLMCRVALPYMHIPTALGEFSRVLRDGGSLWLAIHPLRMFRRDLVREVRARSVKGLVYRLYAMLNSALLLFGVQIRYPLNRARIESYQWRPALSAALRRAGFTNDRMWFEHGNALTAASRAARENSRI